MRTMMFVMLIAGLVAPVQAEYHVPEKPQSGGG